MEHFFHGTGVAVVTPFKENLAIDFEALDKIIDHLLNNGVEYLVVLGTTGESVTLSEQEKSEVAGFFLDKCKGKCPLVLGVGGNNTEAVCRDLRSNKTDGFDAVLSVAPFYNKPSQEGIYRHYEAISKASPLPVILYNVPGRTSSNILPETVVRLARDFSNIKAIKEASGSIDQSMKIYRELGDSFTIISGDDALTLPLMSIGAKGVISVMAAGAPKEYSELVSAALAGDFARARKRQMQLLELMDLIFEEGNPAGIKQMMEHYGLCNTAVRLPLIPASDALAQRIEAAIKQANLTY